MGNGIGKIGYCFTGSGPTHDHLCMHGDASYYDEGLGHSFCYVRPDPTRILPSGPSKIHSEESAPSGSIFRSISGASVSANTSTPLTTSFLESTSLTTATTFSAAFFESSTSFSAVPLQPIPRSGPLSGPLTGPISADHGFMSGPLDRSGGFMSGPLERAGPLFSGPLDRSYSVANRRRRRPGGSLIKGLRRAISKTFGSGAPENNSKNNNNDNIIIVNTTSNNNINNCNMSSEMVSITDDSDESWQSQNLQWAQGKAGEDRVHVVVSEEFGWVFVGIYDGFSGPDATDFLLSNLYTCVKKELKGLLWDDNNTCSKSDFTTSSSSSTIQSCSSSSGSGSGSEFENRDFSKKGRGKLKGVNKKWEENQRRWKCEWDRERIELDRRLKEQWNRRGDFDTREGKMVNHSEVLKALSEGLRKTEDAYLDIADKMLDENPELALMGSCVLAMLMKGEDVYVMNVGDSRAVLGRNKEPDLRLGKVDQDLERINEESMYEFEVSDGVRCNLTALQLTIDHSTSVEEEVQRIRDEHPDDCFAVSNDRVKGSLKVTRAFGAGFLKQKKWNDALLEMFRIDYVGNSPYLNCLPFLYHHRLGPKDQFLILSSDGLYQYFTNEEAVSEVEHFISLSPEGDPAQHLVEEVLFRAAKRAGLDFYELLEIPQGDRRRYHDDVSIIVISFEGRIWRSCV
ncbi:hypothetical protein KSS87_016228 [Heliosperma pusillum]|nr:hypothetical protein KSS87_017042 [Heliosperma pusillum]KAH9627514.1 hypothetical protein KSS87_016228 [Heliosperma pusillum]